MAIRELDRKRIERELTEYYDRIPQHFRHQLRNGFRETRVRADFLTPSRVYQENCTLTPIRPSADDRKVAAILHARRSTRA